MPTSLAVTTFSTQFQNVRCYGNRISVPIETHRSTDKLKIYAPMVTTEMPSHRVTCQTSIISTLDMEPKHDPQLLVHDLSSHPENGTNKLLKKKKPSQPPTRYPQISRHDIHCQQTLLDSCRRRHSGLPQRVCLTSKTWKMIGKSYFLLRYYTWQKILDNTIQTKEHLTPLPCSVHIHNYFLTRNDKVKSSNASYSRKDTRSSTCPVANFVRGARCLLWGVQLEGSTANREALQESRLDTD
jgi:hypothetical protein